MYKSFQQWTWTLSSNAQSTFPGYVMHLRNHFQCSCVFRKLRANKKMHARKLNSNCVCLWCFIPLLSHEHLLNKFHIKRNPSFAVNAS